MSYIDTDDWFQKHLDMVRKTVAVDENNPWTPRNYYTTYPVMRKLIAHLDAQTAEVERLRIAIRKHRDQRLDDRCWMDDIELYESLPEGIDPSFVDLRLLDKDVMMRNCERFVECRSTTLTPEEAVAKYKCR